MKPELYVDQRSPPVRSTLLLVKMLGIDVDLKELDLSKGEHVSKSFIEMNPCHTVPTFRDDHVTLTDSHSILVYLCEKYGGDLGKQLWPSDPIDRINVLNKLFYSGTLLFRRDSDAIGGIIMEKLRKEQIEALHVDKIRDQYDILEKYLTAHKFMATNYMTIADISIVTIVSTVDMIVPVTAGAWPKLHHWWYNLMKELPHYEQANAGLAGLKAWVQQSTDFKIKM